MVLLDNGGRDASEVTLIEPAGDLAHLIEHTWVEDGTHGGSDWRIVADTSPHLVLSVTRSGTTPALRVIVVGARSCAESIDVSARVLTVGVRFRPGAFPRLTGAAARDFVDRSVPIDRVFATRVLSDLELSADAPVPHIVNELFRLTRRAARRPAARWMLSPPAVTSVRELAVRLAMPARSLLDLAYRDIGLSPKRMLRIDRLHAALHASRRFGHSWASVAFEAGYADQAHLSRELRALLGEARSTWASRGSRRFVQDTGCGMR